MKQPRKHTALLFIALGIIALLLLVIDMATGDTYIPVSKVWAVLTGGECDEMTRNILLSIRFIRVIVAALIGVALSVSGLQMQTVFQNPLADPYLLGVSSGAGLGVALFILGAPLLGWSEFPLLQSLGIVGSSWIGTAVILLGVAVISRKVKNILAAAFVGWLAGWLSGSTGDWADDSPSGARPPGARPSAAGPRFLLNASPTISMIAAIAVSPNTVHGTIPRTSDNSMNVFQTEFFILRPPHSRLLVL